MASIPQNSISRTSLDNRQDYRYNPLQSHREIRLLVLHAPDPTSPGLVFCHLQHASLDSDLKYTAVSYCWGDSTSRKPIICSGSLLHVTVNLYNALRDWRPIDGNIQLWADAICINQKDNEEKAFQVMMMGDIYSRAATVWVWLGESSEATSRAYRLIEDIYNHFELGAIDDKYFLQVLAPLRQQCDPDHNPRRNDHVIAASAAMLKVEQELTRNSLVPGQVEDWQALSDVFSLPWFGRKWIIQEVVLAQQAVVFCGVESIPWPRLRLVSAVLPTCRFPIHQLVAVTPCCSQDSTELQIQPSLMAYLPVVLCSFCSCLRASLSVQIIEIDTLLFIAYPPRKKKQIVP
jgi:hypothetical protein